MRRSFLLIDAGLLVCFALFLIFVSAHPVAALLIMLAAYGHGLLTGASGE